MAFKVNFLPGRYGDCIWIEYGDQEKYKILIDGGTKGTRHDINALIETLPENDRHFDLMIVTHIDRDHIEGILSLLEQDNLNFTVDDFWFNGWNHLPDNPVDEFFGAIQGERLTARILKHGLNWNNKFQGKPIVLPPDGMPVKINLKGGMTFTLLSPANENLAKLKEKWEEEVLAANLDPGFGSEEPVDDGIEPFGAQLPDIELLASQDFHEDTSAANGSSIAILAEYEGKTILLAGDAYPSLLLDSLNKLFGDQRASIDVVKLSHHASAHNTSPDLLKKIKSKIFVVSTNGSIFKHPAAVTVARVIKIGSKNKKIVFNYRTKYNEVWDNDLIKQEFGYHTIYPEDENGIVIKLL